MINGFTGAVGALVELLKGFSLHAAHPIEKSINQGTLEA
jgi:hypothetical protein